jgi:hypothetical protein
MFEKNHFYAPILLYTFHRISATQIPMTWGVLLLKSDISANADLAGKENSPGSFFS